MKFYTYALLTGAISANQVNSTKLTQIVTGVLKGALDAEGFDDIDKCITDAKEVYDDVDIAFNDFKSKDVAKIIDGVKHVGDLIKTVKAGMSDCSHLKADWAKLEKMAAIFESPASFAWHVGKDLLLNGVDIYNEINASIRDYENQSWEDFGYDIGEASAKLLLGQELTAKAKLAQVFYGLAEAFGGKIDILALLVCIQDEDKALLMLDAAVQAFETAWKNKEWSDAIGGVIATIAAIQTAKQGLPACEAIDHSKWDMQEFDQSLNIASHPLQYFEIIEEDLTINGMSIVEDGIAATEAYKNGDLITFGKLFGEILKMTTQKPAETEIETEEKNPRTMAEVLQGFLKATNVGHFNFTNLLACIYAEDQAALEFYAAIDILKDAIKDKSIGEGIAGTLFTFAAFQ